MKPLVVEDDTTTGTYVARGLREEGNVDDLVDNGKAGLIAATSAAYDVVILDRMLPEVDGFTVLKTMRGAGNRTPVRLLTALGGLQPSNDGVWSCA